MTKLTLSLHHTARVLKILLTAHLSFKVKIREDDVVIKIDAKKKEVLQLLAESESF